MTTMTIDSEALKAIVAAAVQACSETNRLSVELVKMVELRLGKPVFLNKPDATMRLNTLLEVFGRFGKPMEIMGSDGNVGFGWSSRCESECN